MVIGEIKDIEEYNAKTAELTEACKDYYHEEASVAYVMIAAVFRYGCEMTDAELTQVGLGKFQRVKGDDLSDRAVFEVWINHAGEDTFAAALELSHNENVEHIEIYLMYSVSVPAEH